ncbi:hypothetical protein AVEN_127257-1, partial [Araneus ventricosus]
QEIPCHLYTSELNEKEVLLNTNEGDAEKFRILFDSSEVLSEQDFVYDVLDLLLGIPSNTFLYDDKKKNFQMKPFTRLARMSSESTLQFCENFIECGTTFYKLKTFCSSIHPKEESFFTTFIVERNNPIACADHAGPLFQKMFPDSETAKRYGCACIKTSAIIAEMGKAEKIAIISTLKKVPFSTATDGSNNGDFKSYPLVVT